MSKEIKFLPEYYNNQYSNRINVSDLYYLDKELNKNLESHIYDEIVAFDGYNYRSGWTQETTLNSGEVYKIGSSYQWTKGEARDHDHPVSISGIYVYDVGDIGYYRFYNRVLCSYYDDGEKHWGYILHEYKTDNWRYDTYNWTHNPNNVKENKVFIEKEVNYYKYIGGNFFQDPYTLEYYGKPDEDYFKYTKTTIQEFQENINKEIKKFSLNKDSYNIELRKQIGQLRYDLKMCSIGVIPPHKLEEYDTKRDNFDFDSESVILRQDLNKWMSVNKYYVIEHSTKWRNEFNFSPNKEFLPELEYADVGGHQSSDFTYFSNFFIKENSN